MSGLFDNMRRELQVEAGSGPHPEAEVLNAYLEGVLKPKEREAVVTHLSLCGSCREVVALAAPPVTHTPPPASLKDPAVRLALWRWAVVATTAVVVIAAVVMDSNRRGSQVERLPAMVAAPAAPPAAAAPSAGKAESGPLMAAKTANEGNEKIRAKAAPPAHEADKDAALQAPAPMAEAKKQAPLSAAAKPVQAPTSANEVVVAQPEAATTQAQAATGGAPMRRDLPADRQGLEARSAPAPAPPPPSPAFAEVSNANAGMMKMKSARAATAAMDTVVAAPRWTISGQGAVQKSLDGGGSWQAVSVAPGVRFRAIAAIGADIWAGGAKAMLFHSQDGGQTWTRVQPGGVSGDIVRLEFADPRRGQLSTSAGEKCSTQDGGSSWLCQ